VDQGSGSAEQYTFVGNGKTVKIWFGDPNAN
jgi:hypothetical protein